jgi:DNA-binding CsgD family transcriptional regulator
VVHGELDLAADLAAEQLAFGTANDRPVIAGVGLRIEGLTKAARGDLSAAVTVLEQALTLHRRCAFPLDTARTQLALGQVYRRLRDRAAARSHLAGAAAMFDQLGAAPWQQIAAAELSRLDGPRLGDVLTPTEARITTLAAQGRTNRAIAAELFISVRTVEGHLAAVYRKLGVTGRRDLADATEHTQRRPNS